MKGFLCAAWIGLLFVFTCIWDVTELNEVASRAPQISQHPDWSGFTDGYKLEADMVVRKVGHVAGFAVLQAILYWRFRSLVRTIAMSAAFALLTELLQPLFFRGGRALDVLVDLVGIAGAAIVISVLRRSRRMRDKPSRTSMQ